MSMIAAALGGLGLVCILLRKTLLGVLVGVQLLTIGATMVLLLSGAASGEWIEGHALGLFVSLSGVAQLAAGFALAVRLFYLRKRAGMDQIRLLKH